MAMTAAIAIIQSEFDPSQRLIAQRVEAGINSAELSVINLTFSQATKHMSALKECDAIIFGFGEQTDEHMEFEAFIYSAKEALELGQYHDKLASAFSGSLSITKATLSRFLNISLLCKSLQMQWVDQNIATFDPSVDPQLSVSKQDALFHYGRNIAKLIKNRRF